MKREDKIDFKSRDSDPKPTGFRRSAYSSNKNATGATASTQASTAGQRTGGSAAAAGQRSGMTKGLETIYQNQDESGTEYDSDEHYDAG